MRLQCFSVLLAACFLSAPVWAKSANEPKEPKPVLVKKSDPHVKKIEKAFGEMMQAAMPCIQRKSQEGVPADKVEAACMCESAGVIRKVADTLESVYKAKPEWKGRPLKYKEKDGETTLNLRDPKELRNMLKACSS